MCLFVSIVVPRPELRETLARLWETPLQQVDNPRLTKQLKAGEVQLMRARHGCDCATPLGRPAPTDAPTADWEADIKRLRRKGWSASKIERWIAEKTKAKGRLRIAHGGDDWSLATWDSKLTRALAAPGFPGLALLLHSYEGSLTDEPMRLLKREPSGAQSDRIALLQHFEEDTLYDFAAPAMG